MNPTKQKTFQSPEVRVVEASAGSGKTYALAKRYVQLLLNPDLHPDHIPLQSILAITFTNKAAFEMKARILMFLKSLALDVMPEVQSADMLAPIEIKRDRACKKSAVVMNEVIHHFNYFQVQTIDKFINALLSGCAFKIGLTANFRIRTNSREYLEYSLDQMIDRAAEDAGLSALFDEFLQNYLYLENRTGWFPKKDLLAIIKNLFAQHNTYGQDFLRSAVSSEDIIKRKRKILHDLKALKEALPPEANKGFVKSLGSFLEKNPNSFDVDSLSNYLARQEPPISKKGKCSAAVVNLWENINTNITRLCQDEAYSLFNPYISIFHAAMDGFHEAARKDDVLFLEELNKKAGLLFDEAHLTVEELYYRLATRYHHYLIDEFQDTSRLQWTNVEQMAHEALSTGGTLFYVGDRKQAIYSFRGGDVGLFDDVAREFTPFHVVKESLNKNWRSQKAIVDFNNAIFHPDNLRSFLAKKESFELEKKKANPVVFHADDMKAIEQIYGNSGQTIDAQNNQGYVRMEYIQGRAKEDRNEVLRQKLLALIVDVRKRFSLKDIAILTRSNKDIEMMTGWLLEEGILVNSERTSNVKENAVIQDLLFFLKFLHSPIDNAAFVQFIISDMFTQSTGLTGEAMHEFVFNLRKRVLGEKDFYVYREFRRAYNDIWKEFIEPFFRNVGLYPLYELLLSIFSQYALLEHFKHYQGFLMRFLEIVKKQEEEYADLGAFLDYFEILEGEDAYVEIADSDAVRILTVHKSKGLEFPVVIIPQLTMDPQVGTSSENQKSFVMQSQEEGMRLLRLKGKYYTFNDDLFHVYAEEYKKAFLTELNNVYVALTRPVYELYAFIPEKTGNSHNCVNLLICDDQLEYGQPRSYTDVHEDPQPLTSLPISKYQNWITYLEEEFSNRDDLLNRSSRLSGEVMHFLLSCVGQLTKENIQEVQAEAVKQAKTAFPQVSDFDSYEEQLAKLLSAEKLKDIFFTRAEVYTEKEVVDASGRTKRIDRLMVTPDEVMIVDYKSSAESAEDHFKQVKEYQKMIQKIYPGQNVKGALVYLDTMEVKTV